MLPSVVEQVVDFYSDLFDRIFSVRFRSSISDRLRRNAVLRQVSEAADAAAPCSALLSSVLTEAYLSTGPRLAGDPALLRKVIRRVAALPFRIPPGNLRRYPANEVEPIANETIGRGEDPESWSESVSWLVTPPGGRINSREIKKRLRKWRTLTKAGLSELTLIAHYYATFQCFLDAPEIYLEPALGAYCSQAGVALHALSLSRSRARGVGRALCEVLRAIATLGAEPPEFPWGLSSRIGPTYRPTPIELWPELATLARQASLRFQAQDRRILLAWADALEDDFKKKNKRVASDLPRKKRLSRMKSPTRKEDHP